jgi:beta-xylosidase
MKYPLVLAVLLAVSGASLADTTDITYPHAFDYKGNPLVRYVSSTDPDAHVWDDVVWVYCSQDHPRQPGDKGVYDHMDGYHAFSSPDLIHWTDHGEVMHSRAISWAPGGWLWAPAAARKDGKYYLYYPIKDKQLQWVIGVAIGDSPTGPFKDIGHPIEGMSGIDPAVFIDDDGQAYIYCGDTGPKVAKLKPNMIELAEPMRPITYGPPEVLSDTHRKFREGIYMHKRNGIYYLSFTNQSNKDYQGFYAMGTSPYGPFDWKGPMAPKPDGAQYHHSTIEFKGQWYDFYHVGGAAFKPPGYNGSRRIVCFDKLFYNPDGTIQIVKQTTEQTVTPPSPAPMTTTELAVKPPQPTTTPPEQAVKPPPLPPLK